eukprot:scaffold37684_cov18-Prasinocladus_malaysianus.AAC.1
MLATTARSLRQAPRGHRPQADYGTARVPRTQPRTRTGYSYRHVVYSYCEQSRGKRTARIRTSSATFG